MHEFKVLKFAKLSVPKEILAMSNTTRDSGDGGSAWKILKYGKFISLEHVLREILAMLEEQMREVFEEFLEFKGKARYEFDLHVLEFRIADRGASWTANICMENWEDIKAGDWTVKW